jgi:hypothetical protein
MIIMVIVRIVMFMLSNIPSRIGLVVIVMVVIVMVVIVVIRS